MFCRRARSQKTLTYVYGHGNDCDRVCSDHTHTHTCVHAMAKSGSGLTMAKRSLVHCVCVFRTFNGHDVTHWEKTRSHWNRVERTAFRKISLELWRNTHRTHTHSFSWWTYPNGGSSLAICGIRPSLLVICIITVFVSVSADAGALEKIPDAWVRVFVSTFKEETWLLHFV